MEIKTRCLPLGALPYESIQHATNMMAKLFPICPFLPFFPLIDSSDSAEKRTLCGMPGIKIEPKKISIKAGTKLYDKEMSNLDKVFNSPSIERLEQYSFENPFFDKYLNIIKKFKSHNASMNLTGPFTLSQLLMNAAKEQMLADKNYRKLFTQSVCVKALWVIEKIKEYCPTTKPIIILEEPLLGRLGVVKRENENITTEIVTNMLARVIEKIHNAGAIVGIQCFDKCDWTVPINAGADLISFDAYNNPNNINIIPEQITEFIQRGGMINWAIVPAISENHIKSLTVDYLAKRLSTTMEGLFLAGVPMDLIYKSAMVSTNGNLDKLPVMFAEKALLITTQLASRIAVRSHGR